MTTTSVTFNGAIPNQPQTINAFIEINSSSVLVDLTMQLAQGKIAGVQTVYVDLINHPGDVSIYMPDTGQRITAKSHTQGYYPVLSTNLMKFEISSTVNGKFPIQFINFPIALGVWGHNVIKGDKGDPGIPGQDGGLIVTENSVVPANGKEIAVIENDVIKLKRLVAGANITLTETVDAITINSSGGGGAASPAPIYRATYTGAKVNPNSGSTVSPLSAAEGVTYTENQNTNPEIFNAELVSGIHTLTLSPGIYEFTFSIFETDVIDERYWIMGIMPPSPSDGGFACTDAHGSPSRNGALCGSFTMRIPNEIAMTPYVQQPGTGSTNTASVQLMIIKVRDL